MGRRISLAVVVVGLAVVGHARADDVPNAETHQPTLVYTSRMLLRADARDSAKRIRELTESLGGRLVNTSDSQIALEVPRERYRELVLRLGELGWLRSEQLSTEDVTDAISERAAAARAAALSRDQLGRVTQLAQGTEEHLIVERELEAATDEISQAERQRRELAHRADSVHVAIQLEIPAVEPIANPVLPFPWLGELSLERLANTEPPAPQPSRVLRSFFDFTGELRLTHIAHPDRLDGVSKSGAVAFSLRGLGEANPVGFFGGMDLVLGASRGFVYGTQLLGGIGMPIGRRIGFGLATGPGIDGITSVVPFGVDVPLEFYFSLDVARPLAASAWVRDGWVFGSSERRHGSSHAPFGDELAAGMTLAFGTRDSSSSYTERRGGPIVGFAYREAMDAKLYEIRLGWGGHEADFSETY